MLHSSRLKTDTYSHTKPIKTLVWNIADHLIGALNNINYFLKTQFLFYSFFTFKLLKCKKHWLFNSISPSYQENYPKVVWTKLSINFVEIFICACLNFSINFHKRKEKHFCISIAWLKNKKKHLLTFCRSDSHVIKHHMLQVFIKYNPNANFLQFNQVQIFCLIDSTAFSLCFYLNNLSEIVYN